MAHAVLMAVDQPDNAGGEIFHCGDVTQMTLAQWVEVITREMDNELEVVSVPGPMAYPARDMMINRRTADHQLFKRRAPAVTIMAASLARLECNSSRVLLMRY